MRLGIVSDTHGHLPNTREAIHYLNSLEVDEILHCGDIGSTDVIDLFMPWPTHFVSGNVDRYDDELRTAVEAQAGFTWHGEFGQVERETRRIAWLHGDDEKRLEKTIHSGGYHLVCHGHTHLMKLERVGETIVLNPGALYRASPLSLAIVDLPEMTVEHIKM